VSDWIQSALAQARLGREHALATLDEFLRFPTISAHPEHSADLVQAADWLRSRLDRLGMKTEIAPGSPHPSVVGEWVGRPGMPVLAIYAHYDVQPPAPLEEWRTPPFEPSVRDGYVYARGSRDDKGQLIATLVALECAFADGEPPLNLRVFYEGEEEIAGTTMGNWLRANAHRVPTEYLLLVDGQFLAPGVPAVVTGLRGILYVVIEATGTSVDLHSGLYGGVAPNALNTLIDVLASLRSRDGRVAIPGFYDDVRAPTDEELRMWESVPLTEADLLRDMGAESLEGEAEYGLLERLSARPTLDIHGVVGGYQGEGAKTVIPARALAKVSMRLAPDQDPKRILASLEDLARRHATPGVKVAVTPLEQNRAAVFGTDHALVEATRRSLHETFAAEPILMRLGGSVAVAADFQDALDPKIALAGFGFPGDNNHAPNERFSIEQFHRASEAVLRLIDELARLA
jgi:acetylornithine deacetylase/succinyl-diaminopimelate desuccinylase-like protein